MAKANKSKSTPQNTPVTDLSYWYSDLAMMPQGFKESMLWCGQMLFFMKLNSVPLVDAKKATEYRKLNLLQLNRQTYVDMIDPPTPMGGGGKAEYFASDFKANPINIHLQNITDAKLDKIGTVNKLQVNEIDKFAKSQRQKDKDKIIHQRTFRDLIKNVIADIGGLPPISESESPEEYINNLSEEKGVGQSVDDVSRIIQQIQLQIKDSKDYALYERYVYKGEIERAFELGMEHYLINQNKWRIKSNYFNQDLRNFNRAVGRAYTDETNGRQTVEYIDPTRYYTNQFMEKNGEDIIHQFYEKDITFAEFIRQLGTTLTDEQLKEVFELNKYSGSIHGLSWSEQPTTRRNNALIRIGYASVLTQEAQEFSEEYINNRIPSYKPKTTTWEPDTESAAHKQKIYNVWYSFYYIPPPGEQLTKNSQASWEWQSKYIFNIKKDIDMYRYGIDMRYAKSTFVVWKDERPSFTDIEQAFMPKIHTTWHKFQNCLVQDTTALAIDFDLISGLLNATDESNVKNPNQPDNPTAGNGVDAGMEAWRSLKQGGMGFLKFRDKNGNIVVPDPSKLFVPIDTGHLEKAERYLQIILQQYEMMKMALAQNDITEGQAPKPRTAVAGIEASIEASNNAIWFLEKPVREFLIMFGERNLQWQLHMVKEKKVYDYPDRWNEYKEVVGLANALMVEGIEDLDPEDLGITVSLEDTTSMQEYVFQLANEMAKNKEVSRDAVALVVDMNRFSWKYGISILMLSAKEQAEENAAQEELNHKRQMELQQMQLQTAIALQGAKSQGVQAEIQTQGVVDYKLQEQANAEKFNSQSQLKNQNTQNRILENDARENKKAEVENQRSLI